CERDVAQSNLSTGPTCPYWQFIDRFPKGSNPAAPASGDAPANGGAGPASPEPTCEAPANGPVGPAPSTGR
ncbi:hypothetical protein EG872_16135, partial [Enterococcus faecalis]